MTEVLPDLPIKYLDRIKSILNETLPGRKVWMFGSRVNGTSCETSDIDLVFFPEEGQPGERWGEAAMVEEARTAFRESNIPLFVDILSWRLIPESFHQEILNQKHIELQ